MEKKNINVYLSTEIFYLILTSLIVFTSNPLNWIVAILMFLHLIGIAWLVASPNSFYQMAEESINLDSEMTENAVVIMFLIYAGMALFSRILSKILVFLKGLMYPICHRQNFECLYKNY